MANFYTDNPHIQYHLQHPLMERIAQLKERDYADADQYDYAPSDYADALDSYQRVLEVVGEVCGEVIAPRGTCLLRSAHSAKPGYGTTDRSHGYVTPPSLRRSQHANHSLYYGCRHGLTC